MKSKKLLNILITGGAGYLGSILTTKLVELGHNVTVIDILEFNKVSLSHLFSRKNFIFIRGDVRNKELIKKEIKKKDIIIPLAALVGAPLCKKYPNKTKEINFNCIKFILSKITNKQKIIYPNTNSGYGVGKKNSFCDENSPLNPISLYGKTIVNAEKIILKHKNSIVFRLATVFGYSYRMRTDLLVNFLVKKAIVEKEIKLFEPHFRRNYIHVLDVANAFVFAINNFSKMRGNIYNVGLSDANLTKLQLVKLIKKYIVGINIKYLKNKKDPDKRDYFVSNKKIEKFGFRPIHQIDEGIDEMTKVFKIKTKFNNNY
jgi:nucleoside-diphosphate-sugar epimerase